MRTIVNTQVFEASAAPGRCILAAKERTHILNTIIVHLFYLNIAAFRISTNQMFVCL